MTSRFSLEGKHALVTGATRGIGLAIARGFLESGATVTICGRKPAGLEDARQALAEFAGKFQAVAAHVGRADDLARLVDQARQAFGPIGILVNNAGTNPYFGPIVESDAAAWDKTMEVNLRGPYLLATRVAVAMRGSGGGSIINIASIAGLTALPNQGIYCVSKAGLVMLTRVLARELGGDGIRVNCICPGLIKTQLSEALWTDPAREQSITRMKALGRIGVPDEIAGAAIYLASDAASFTTGAVLQVDGGLI